MQNRYPSRHALTVLLTYLFALRIVKESQRNLLPRTYFIKIYTLRQKNAFFLSPLGISASQNWSSCPILSTTADVHSYLEQHLSRSELCFMSCETSSECNSLVGEKKKTGGGVSLYGDFYTDECFYFNARTRECLPFLQWQLEGKVFNSSRDSVTRG